MPSLSCGYFLNHVGCLLLLCLTYLIFLFLVNDGLYNLSLSILHHFSAKNVLLGHSPIVNWNVIGEACIAVL